LTPAAIIKSNELVGGFALLEAKSKDEAIELAKRFLNVGRRGRMRASPTVRSAGSGRGGIALIA
jgi:hypothetical protein